MKYVACNYCGSDDAQLVNRGADLYLNRPGDFQLVRCRNCGLIYQNPQLSLDELLAYYPFESYERYMAQSEEHRLLDRGLLRRCKRILHYQGHPGSLLDVGCATGAFLERMQRQGWQVAGIELNPEAAEYARSHKGLEVHTGTLEVNQLAANTFDVVTMWDVFEHVIDPRETLVHVRHVMKPGGLLVLSLPNPLGIEARLFGPAWAGWDRPRHLHIFTPAVLKCYLSDAGFRMERIESLGGRLNVTLLSIAYLCKARGIPKEKWGPWVDRMYNWPLRLLTWPLYRLAEAVNQTTTMTVFGRLIGEGWSQSHPTDRPSETRAT